MKLSFVFTALLCAGRAWAGPTAHVSGPSEDFQGYLQPALVTAVNLAEGRDAAGARPGTVSGIGLIMGVLPGKPFLAELGADYKSCGDPADDNPVYFNGKLGLAEGALGAWVPALAAGVFDAGTNAERSAYNIWYAQAGKTVKAGGLDLGRFSAGWFRGDPDLLLDGDGRRDNEGFLAGWDRTIPELSDRLWASVDYMGTKSAYGSLNFGLAWKFNSQVTVLAGYNIFNDGNIVNTYNLQLTLGLGPDPR